MNKVVEDALKRARELDAGRPPRYTKWIPTIPTIKQAKFLDLECLEAGYGGAVGGGKSRALLMAALQYVDVPNYSALLVRKTFTDLSLPGALIPMSHEFLNGTGAKWKDQQKLWVFPSGATLKFGYLENEYDHLNYQGAEFQFIGFDELTQLREEHYTYMFSRLRKTTDIPVPLRVRSATNPGGPGHEWVKRRFIDGTEEVEPDVLHKVVTDDDGKEDERYFVKSFVFDNQHLDQEYQDNLKHLDPVTKQQLLRGDWDISPTGEYFQLEWFRKKKSAPLLQAYIRSWDTSVTKSGDATASSLMTVDEWKNVYILDQTEDHTDVKDLVDLIVRTSKKDPPGTMIAIEDVGISKPTIHQLKQHPDLEGTRIISVPVHKITGPRMGNDKLSRATAWINKLANGQLYLIEGDWNDRFVSQCLRFQNEKTDTDDLIDSVSVGYSQIFKQKGINRKQDYGPEVGSPNWYLQEREHREREQEWRDYWT